MYGTVPRGRYFSSCSVYKDALYVFGGMVDDNHGDNELFALDLKSYEWEKIETNGVDVMKTNGMTSCIHEDTMYVFGGFNHNKSKFASTLYAYHFPSKQWSIVRHVGAEVPRRAYHTAVIYENKMCIYGGKTPVQDPSNVHTTVQDVDLNFRLSMHREKIYTFDLVTKRWDTLPANFDVPNVFFHQSVVHGNRMYSIGGNDRKNHCYHFYEFDFLTKAWLRYDTKWHFLTTDIVTHLCPEGLCYDVLFELKDKVHIKAHRAFLAQSPALNRLLLDDCMVHSSIVDQCSTFSEMLQSSKSLKDSDESTKLGTNVYLVSLPTIDPLHFQQLLYFLYGSEQLLILDCLQLLDLMDLLLRFEMHQVLEMCYRAFQNHLNVQDVIHVLKSEKLTKFDNLRDIAMNFISCHYDEVANLPELNSLSKDLILQILRLPRSASPSLVSQSTFMSPPHHLLLHLKKLRETSLYADVSLMAKDSTTPIRVHRSILAAQSEYFHNLFSGEYTDSFSDCVKLPTTKEVLHVLLDYFYEGSLNVDCTSSRQTTRALDLDEFDHPDDDAASFFSMMLDVGTLADFISHNSLENAARLKLLSQISLENVNAVLLVLSHYPSHKFSKDIRERCTYYLSSMPVQHIISNFISVVVGDS
eukprot:CAMPEP_0117426620 /NCGR_PEP_ID=MMETSP0758-20121206/6679_1 /TAXON_ID=63605 /ORGANISM="Percolomonas cosmopolitus, Strain AE-1 (ATCC 50343)" /LENGTH=639 /DNA_ID=CAMNT_0005211861 /DNA_START=792 /DNA_END=2711 /DNA_ORIENTATION=-